MVLPSNISGSYRFMNERHYFHTGHCCIIVCAFIWSLKSLSFCCNATWLTQLYSLHTDIIYIETSTACPQSYSFISHLRKLSNRSWKKTHGDSTFGRIIFVDLEASALLFLYYWSLSGDHPLLHRRPWSF